jgi:hypothetical protein
MMRRGHLLRIRSILFTWRWWQQQNMHATYCMMGCLPLAAATVLIYSFKKEERNNTACKTTRRSIIILYIYL